MTTTIIRPAAASSTSADWSIQGGAASTAIALNDNLDTTYVRSNNPTVASLLRVTLADITLTGTQRVEQVRIRVRARRSGTGTDLRARLKDLTPGAAGQTSLEDRWTTISTSFTEYVGAWRVFAPQARVWTEALVDNLAVELRNLSTSVAEVAEVYVDVDVRTQATVAVSAPSGSVTTTTRPVVTSAFTDPDLGNPFRLEVKIFDSATYSAGGFSADTSTPVWSTGPALNSDPAPSVTPTVDLTNGTSYRAYVRMSKVSSGGEWWSAWAFSAFSISLTAPAAPTVSTAYDSTTHRTTVTVTGSAAPAGTTAYQYVVQRDVAGAGYQTISTITGLPTSGAPGAKTAVDDYVPRGVAVTYRAQAVATISGVAVGGAYGSAARTVATDKRWILRPAPADRSGTSWVDAYVTEAPNVTVEESAAVFRPLGRTRAVVVTAGVHGEDGSYGFVVRTAATWAIASPVLLSSDPIFVTDPFGGTKFVRFLSRDWDLLGGSTVPRRPVNVGYVEVDDPYADTG